MWKRLFLLRESSQRRGLGRCLWGHLSSSPVPLATCLGVLSLRRGNGHPLAGLLSFLFFPIQLLERQLITGGPQTPASVFGTPVMSNYKSSLAKVELVAREEVVPEPGC